MFRIRTLNNIAQAGLSRMPASRYEVATDLADPDAIVVRSCDMHQMDLPSGLGLLAVARAGAGVNNVPVERLSRRGIPVFNAPGANANAVKELVLAAMLMAARNLLPAAQFVRSLTGTDDEISRAVEAGKKRFVGIELPNRTLGVIGLGAIGVEVANAALGLGMNVIGYDPNITVQRAWQLLSGVEKARNLDEIFSNADVLSLHLPLTNETRGLVNYERLSSMPGGGILLNFARGAIVDADGVELALSEGNLRYYVTDFPSPRLKNVENVISLPHLGASTGEAEENSAVMVIDNLRQFLEHGNVRHSVNFPEAVLERKRPDRVAIAHENVPNMVAQILASLGQEKINIADMLNQSRAHISYTIVDVDSPVSPATLERIRQIDGILSARILPTPEPSL